jgi:activator of HSP90 ATPase
VSRSFIIAVLLAASPIASGQADKPKEGAALLNENAADKAITIHQEVEFTARPQQVYEALLDEKQFAAFSGKPAEINREGGGAFSLFEGHIVGRNVELVPNQRIVQAWRAVDWPEGVYSIAKFELKQQGTGTHLVFDHVGFPIGLRDHLAEGWEDHYWSLLKKYFH